MGICVAKKTTNAHRSTTFISAFASIDYLFDFLIDYYRIITVSIFVASAPKVCVHLQKTEHVGALISS